MNAVTPKLSVIICTHNPKPEYLQRVIGGAPGADARASEWELLVVDNKSTRPVSESVDLSWHPHAAVSIEEQLSTTAARLHGLRRTRADVLVFVDDDNVLAPDYLERALDIALTWPMLGSWGSAWCIQEFETDPPRELAPFLYCLGRVESEKPTWSNYEDSFRSVPIGAGVCLRRVVVETYAGLLAKTPARARLDRSGHNLLLSGADWDLALTAVDCGLGTARFPELKVKHLIKKERLVLDYLLRLHIGIAYATTWVKHFRGTLRRPYLEDRIAARLGEIRLSALERKFAHATRSGVALAQADIRAANTPGLPTAASMFETLLARLPAAPPGKDGWPWTIESPTPAPGDSWPRITVVTPSYMQGEFLEQTIRAVLLQNYPNLEYFVLDGGSTDGSREIIEKYAPWLAGWRCETDRGQAATINEGWARAGGDVLAWINSDDWYQPGALAAIASLFREPTAADWVAGPVDDCAADGTYLRRHPARPTPLAEALGFHRTGYYQPGMFWSRRLVEKIGWLDEGTHLCFDLDFWARSLVAGFTLLPLEKPIACFRKHTASKTSSQLEETITETLAIFRRHSANLSPPERRQSAAWLREYAAEVLLHIVYGHLSEGRKAQAWDILRRQWRSALALRPRRLICGLLYRVLISGHPPSWFLADR